MADELTTFGGETESEFIKMGGWLGDFHVRATTVSRYAFKAADMMTSHESTAILNGLLRFLEKMEGQIREIEAETHNSSRLLERMDILLRTLHEPVREFRKIVKALLAIGFTTRIESGAALGHEGDFSTLALDIKRLAEVIGARSSRVLEDVSLLQQEIHDAISQMGNLQEVNSERLKKRITHAREIILSLIEKRGRVAGMTDFLSRKSTEVTDHIGEIVSSIQFHDITRQKVEHVKTTLENLHSESCKDNKGEDGKDTALLVAEVCRLQKAQLKSARDELESAVYKIVDSIHELSDNVSMVACETMKVSGAADRDNCTFFTEMEPALNDVKQVLSSASEVNRLSADLIGSVVGRISDMSFIVGEIELIGEEMKVVASNAGIRAAHAGTRGATLGVISTAIQNLSGEALFQTITLAREFQGVAAQATSLNEALKEGHKNREENISSMGKIGEGQLESLKGINNDFLSLLNKMQGEADILAHDVHVAASSFTVHHKACRLIDDVIDGLDGLIVETGDSSRHEELRENELFREMMSRYTMQSERQVHLTEDFGGLSALTPEGRLQFSQGEDGGTHGLGVNVELF